ncbi:MAG: hypothetical protein ACOX44_13500 [Limnochordia bacterium]
MPTIGDILQFREDLFFDGAVQLDWFYDKELGCEVAKAFVFHGPQYFGVDSEDIGVKSHQLIDTCSFSRLIADYLNGDTDGKTPMLMGIAGYGTGKSHLALSLSTLFSGHDPSTARQIIYNIKQADEDIGLDIEKRLTKPNLIIALNGMRDFNLNYEILHAAQKALLLHGQDDALLKQLTKSHEIARHFLERSFHRLEDAFTEAATERFPGVRSTNLLTLLSESLLSSSDAFEVINRVYYMENGSYIRWDDGISASSVLERLSNTVCGEQGYFNKVLVIFDEFGRFIEYGSQYPTLAGESALQQMFESVQNSNGNIVMVCFIQSDLRSYLARVDKSANIIRYVGRYETAEKVYLSSNLETIFANLIDRKDPETFKRYIVDYHTRNQTELIGLHHRLKNWLPIASYKSVWREWDSFYRVIIKGTYPLHPITTWMLSTFSEWLQQRSALTFLRDALIYNNNIQVGNFDDIPYIRATNLIQSDFFKELLFAEEQGRQQSEFCIQYNGVLRKHTDKLSLNDRSVLAANLVARLGRFRTDTRENAQLLIADCCGLTQQEVIASLQFLEEELGVLSFDSHSGSFDFIEDAIGAVDFKRAMERKRRSTKINLSLIFDGEVSQLLIPDLIQQTDFAERHNIKTKEWDFTQEIIWIENLTPDRLRQLFNDWKSSITPDKPKGKVIWIYIEPDSPAGLLDQLHTHIQEQGLFASPIVFMLLDDASGQFYGSLIEWQTARSLSNDEEQRYNRFISSHRDRTNTVLQGRFRKLQSQRMQLTTKGVDIADRHLRNTVYEAFKNIYGKVIPFMFEGFRAKNYSTARKNLCLIARSLCSGLVHQQWVLAQNTEIRNRLQAVLYKGRKGSWGVLNEHYRLVPPSDPLVQEVFEEIDRTLKSNPDKGIGVGDLLNQLTAPPYGTSNYAAALLVAVYLAYKGNTVKLFVDSKRLALNQWAEKVFLDKEISFDALSTTTMQYVDEEDNKNKFIILCHEIETNCSLNNWRSLSRRLETLCEEEEPPKDILDRVQYCQEIASSGTKIWNEYRQFIKDEIKKYKSAKKSGDVEKALNIIQRCSDQMARGRTLKQYAYGTNEQESLKKLSNWSSQLIEKSFDSWITTIQCTNYAQFPSFQNSVKRLINDFDRQGYQVYAYRLQVHLKEIKENLEEFKVRPSHSRHDRWFR